jgi:hypothetical protein
MNSEQIQACKQKLFEETDLAVVYLTKAILNNLSPSATITMLQDARDPLNEELADAERTVRELRDRIAPLNDAIHILLTR